jgi:rhamnosyltransferase subunit B
MKTVLMGWELGGGLGHLMRLRPLAVALLEAGHNVVLLARHRSAKEVFADLANSHSSLRIGPAPAVKRKRDSRADPTITHTLADVLATQGFGDTEALFAAAERWHLVIDQVRPDLVVCDFSPTLNLVARSHVPLVVVGSGFTVPPDTDTLPPIAPWEDSVPAPSRANEALLIQTLARIVAANRLAPVDRLAQLFRGDATFACTLPELDPYRSYRRSEPHIPYNLSRMPVGPAWQDRADNTAFLYLDGRHPHIEALLDVLRQCGVDGAAFVPKPPEALVRNGALGRLRLFETPPPLEDVLPRVRVLIHHGGLGTALAGLAAGMPQMLLPRHLEDHVTGYPPLQARDRGQLLGHCGVRSSCCRGSADTASQPPSTGTSRWHSCTPHRNTDPAIALQQVVDRCRSFLA